MISDNLTVPRPYRAIWITKSKALLPLLPLRGFIFMSMFVCAIVAIAFLVEKELKFLAAEGLVVSQPWVADNQLINRENYAKIQSSMSSPVFRSLGYSPPEHIDGRHRVLVIGDSFIWGDGLSNINITWWRQLQWELERRGYLNVDVVAAGVNGASTQDQYGWLTNGKLIEKTKPDIVVFGYVTNDPQMKDAKGNDMVKQMSPGAGVTLQSSALGRLFPNLAFELSTRISKKREHRPDNDTGYPYGLWELKILEGQNFKEYKALLSQLARTIEASSIPAFFVTTPNAPNAESFEVRYAPVRSAFKEAGIRLVDLLPPLLECCGNNAGQLVWGTNPANGHPGPRMTHFYASHIADILEKEYPHVLGLRAAEMKKFAPKLNDWLPASLAPRNVAPGEWEVDAHIDRSRLLFMPIEEPHFALNFERPVSVRRIRLYGGENITFRVWATVLDDLLNYELRDYVLVGEGKGGDVSITVPAEISGKRISSLRIVAVAGQMAAMEVAELAVKGIAASEGGAYYYPLPEFADSADSVDVPARSKLVLLEDGKALSHPHSLHDDIRKHGKGRYSHWQSGILFSSSDNSDPRSNGRRYSIGTAAGPSKAIRIGIDFNAQAVRL